MCSRHRPEAGADSEDPMDTPCTYCGAEPMEPCNWDCASRFED